MNVRPLALERPTTPLWNTPERYWAEMTRATTHLDAPVAAIHLGALAANAHDMLSRAAGTPIRVASKSVRARAVLDAVLALPGFRGVLAYTLAEALWLARTVDDVVVGYPSAERGALQILACSPEHARQVTLTVDSVDHLDLIDSVLPPSRRETLRIAIDIDASYRDPVLGRVGVWRSPVRTPDEALALARAIAGRRGFELVGIVAYEAQIAGVPDRSAPGRNAAVRVLKRRSSAELVDRRAAIVGAVGTVAHLEFVNGGGTGSIESTREDPSVTEIGAGSGLLGGHLFDSYTDFRPAPAAAWALDVVRRPSEDRVTVQGGGWVASGPPGLDRLPVVAWPEGLRMEPREMAGEVQTPLRGEAARTLRIGDRVWLRHAKSGELGERVREFALVDDGTVVHTVPSYRGEGMAFL